MRRALLLLAAIAAGAMGTALSPADSWCVRSGITILGEPWLAHETCVPCPVTPCALPLPDTMDATEGLGLTVSPRGR